MLCAHQLMTSLTCSCFLKHLPEAKKNCLEQGDNILHPFQTGVPAHLSQSTHMTWSNALPLLLGKHARSSSYVDALPRLDALVVSRQQPLPAGQAPLRLGQGCQTCWLVCSEHELTAVLRG